MNNKGFTLIELLVVVLIIGILAAVALPQYTKAVEKSRTAEAVTLLGDVMTAQRIYQLSNEGCGELDVLDIEVPSTTTNFNIALNASNKCIAEATRKGSNSYVLSFELKGDGTIERKCAGNDICKAITNSNEWVTYTGA